MIGLQIFAGVAQAEAEKMVQDYVAEYWAAWGIDIKPKATADPKPVAGEDPFAIPNKR